MVGAPFALITASIRHGTSGGDQFVALLRWCGSPHHLTIVPCEHVPNALTRLCVALQIKLSFDMHIHNYTEYNEQ